MTTILPQHFTRSQLIIQTPQKNSLKIPQSNDRIFTWIFNTGTSKSTFKFSKYTNLQDLVNKIACNSPVQYIWLNLWAQLTYRILDDFELSFSKMISRSLRCFTHSHACCVLVSWFLGELFVIFRNQLIWSVGLTFTGYCYWIGLFSYK